jgi:triacylglycerol lipase
MLHHLASTDFSLPRAVALAEASAAAYHPIAQADATAAALGLPNLHPFQIDRTQGFWSVDFGAALLAFRGSELRDWPNNLRLTPTLEDNHPWGRVHRGFEEALDAIIPHLHDFDAATAHLPQVWLTGHSLGGALAVLAGVWLHQRGRSVYLHTYGQPMVGLESFAQQFEAQLPGRLTRFVNQRDAVPCLPGLLYRHCGTLRHIVRPGQLESLGRSAVQPLPIFTDQAPAPLDADEIDELLDLIATLPPQDDANPELHLEGMGLPHIGWGRDHSIANYIRLLREIRDAAGATRPE